MFIIVLTKCDSKGIVKNALKSKDVVIKSVEHLATLWAGMGNVYSIKASDGDGPMQDVVCKHICFPKKKAGKSLSHGNQRKVLSYAVEEKFYNNMAERCIKAGWERSDVITNSICSP